MNRRAGGQPHTEARSGEKCLTHRTLDDNLDETFVIGNHRVCSGVSSLLRAVCNGLRMIPNRESHRRVGGAGPSISACALARCLLALERGPPMTKLIQLRRLSVPVILLLVFSTLAIIILATGNRTHPFSRLSKPSGPKGANSQQLVENYGKLPLSFEANQGQAGPGVAFLSRGSGYTLFLTGDEAVLALRSQEAKVKSQKRQWRVTSDKWRATWNSELGTLNLLHSPFRIHNSGLSPAPSPQSLTPEVLRMKLVGANRTAKVTGLDELPGKANYFIGNDPKKWRTDVPTYAKVQYRDVYPGIDLVYYGNQGKLEYDFVVAPGADPNAIALAVGAGLVPAPVPAGTGPAHGRPQGSPLRIDANGDLVIATDGGEVRFHKPTVYQPQASKTASGNSEFIIHNSELEGNYVLTANNRVRFEIPNYDKTKPLVIDPVLVYSTYVGGGSGVDGFAGSSASAIALDSAGNAYVTSNTCATDFPTTSGAFQPSSPDTNCNVFVTKLNPSASALAYSTYLGGATGGGRGNGVAVDSAGNAYITGLTTSTDFPLMNAFQPTYAGGTCPDDCGDAFVTKINAAGDGLVYSTYLAGSVQNEGFGIVVDSAGSAYVTGSTYSADFPTTAGAFQATYPGGGGLL
ncbi:MAG: hypothetical protein DMG21_16690 [Acidobacteria bacterium]|nr:MAG: hypothetical protein DMG21_16690 [Acidobacteriota bacterium]